MAVASRYGAHMPAGSRSIILLALAAAGCAHGDSAYPSLATRPIEARGFPAIEPDPVKPAAVDPSVAAQVTTLEQGSIAADREFNAALPQAQRQVARAGAAGTENWVVAQQALSALGSIRARGRSDLSALDQLQHDLLASGDGAKIAAAPEVAAAAARIAAREATQSDALSTLEAKLGGQ